MQFFSIVFVSLISTALASPSGAGACPAGEAAPGGPHLTGSPGLVGELSEGNYVVTVGGTPVPFDGTPIDAPLDFDIEVTAAGTEFKGILIRVGGTSVDQVTSPDLTAPAGVCGEVGSVTHSDNSPKTVGTASVSLDEASTLDVDVSIVLENSGGVSTFYYSSFQVNAIDDAVGGESPEQGAGPGDEETMASPSVTPEENITEPPAMMPIEDAPVDAPTSNVPAIASVTATLFSAMAFLL